MKKLLLSFIALFCFVFAGYAEEVKFDFVGDGTSNLYGMTRLSGTTSEYNADPTKITEGNVTITLTGNTRLWKDGLRFYKSSAIEFAAPQDYVITAITIGNDKYSSFDYGTTALGSANWTGNAETVKFTCNITKSNVAVNTLTVTVEKKGSSNLEPAGLSFGETKEYTVKLGEAFTAPTLINPNNLAVEWDSSDENVATVYGGELVIVGVGTATISVLSEATDVYDKGEASYKLTVVDPNAPATAEVTFDFENETYGMTRLSGSTNEYNPNPTTVNEGVVQIVLTGNTRLWSDGVRFYKGSAMEISAPGYVITGITFGKNHGSFNYGTTALTSANWTGKEETVKFTCNIASKNVAVNTLTITVEKKGDANKGDANLSFAENNFTAKFEEGFTAPTLINPNNLAVTYTSSDEKVATVAANGKVTLVGAGTTKITAASAETDKFNAGSAFYTLTVVKSYKTVADFYTVGENNKGIIDFELIVTYVNGQNCYAQTEDGEATLIFAKTEYEVGAIIPAGWEGTYSPFKGLPEIKPVGALPAKAGSTTFEAPEVESITEADVNKVVVLKNVEFAEATSAEKANFNGTVNGQSLQFRNNFTLASVEAGAYDVKCAVAIFSNDGTSTTLQAYPIEYIKVNGIEDVVIDENAPVEYFNLQGVRVAEPTPGLYIIRQGNKVSKTIVR